MKDQIIKQIETTGEKWKPLCRAVIIIMITKIIAFMTDFIFRQFPWSQRTHWLQVLTDNHQNSSVYWISYLFSPSSSGLPVQPFWGWEYIVHKKTMLKNYV